MDTSSLLKVRSLVGERISKENLALKLLRNRRTLKLTTNLSTKESLKSLLELVLHLLLGRRYLTRWSRRSFWSFTPATRFSIQTNQLRK